MVHIILQEMEKVQWNPINKKQNVLRQSNNEKSSALPRPLNK